MLLAGWIEFTAYTVHRDQTDSIFSRRQLAATVSAIPAARSCQGKTRYLKSKTSDVHFRRLLGYWNLVMVPPT
jgi:hypothetical protein